jgi:hypothetical protein
MMARNQSFRYQSPTELLHDLEALAVSGPLPARRPRSSIAPAITVTVEQPPRAEHWSWGLLTLTALVLAAGAVLVWFLLPH